MNVKVGREIFSDTSPQAIGRVGAVLSDQVGNLVIATSRDFLSHCQEIKIQSDGEMISVGDTPYRYHPTETNPSLAINLLGWFTPDTTVKLELESMSKRKLDSMQNIFMQDVVVLGIDQDETKGFVSKVDCFANFTLPNCSTPQLIDGLIRVKNKPGHGAFATAGSAGALVTTVDGSLVGFVVGLLDDGALVAPLKELCEQESFTLATNQQIVLHNSYVHTESPATKYATALPKPIVEIRNAIVPAGVPDLPNRQIIADWLHEGWNDVISHRSENAFTPYSEYFKDVDHNLYTLDEAFTLFVEAELGRSTDFPIAVSDDLMDGYLDFVEIVNSDEKVIMEISNNSVEGSHHRVLRDLEVDDAA